MNMQNILKKYAPLLFIVLLVACKSNLSVKEAEVYIQDPENGISKTTTAGNAQVTMTYVPVELVFKNELEMNTANKNQILDKYSGNYYFSLSLQNDGSDYLNSTAGNRQFFADLNSQLSFGLRNNVYALDTNNDTVYLADFVFPRLYEASKATMVLLVFNSEKLKTNDFKICVKNLATVSSSLTFNFNKTDITNIPPINI